MENDDYLHLASENVDNALVKRVQTIRQASLFVKAGLIAIMSAFVAIAQLVQVPAGGSLSGWQWAGILAATAAAIGGIFAIWTDHDATSELMVASREFKKAKDVRLEYENALRLERSFNEENDEHFSRYSAMYEALKLITAALETAAAESLTEEDACTLILKAGSRSLRIAMDFRTEDQATICIYKAESDSVMTVLRCIAHWREIECDVSKARTWEKGVGVGGICHANGAEIIVPDIQANGVREIFTGHVSNIRDYDLVRYRSMVAVPILINGSERFPWGVVVATNNRTGHFSQDDEGGLRPDGCVRTLANMVALGVTHSRCRANQPPQADT